MRIINQHRNRSVNFGNVEIRVDDTRIFAESGRKILLGEYDTEERALEVFKEIHKAYTGALWIEGEMEKLKGFDVDKMPKVEGGFLLPEIPKPSVIISENIVYEMPIS